MHNTKVKLQLEDNTISKFYKFNIFLFICYHPITDYYINYFKIIILKVNKFMSYN